MSDIVIKKPDLNSADMGRNMAMVDTWIHDTADKINYRIAAQDKASEAIELKIKALQETVQEAVEAAANSSDQDEEIIIPDDYVTDHGESDGWTFRKWNSGLIEAWGVASVTTGSTWTETGSVYRSSWSASIPEAAGFTSAPGTIITNGASAQNVFTVNGGADSATALSGYAFRGGSFSQSSSITISIYAWGT